MNDNGCCIYGHEQRKRKHGGTAIEVHKVCSYAFWPPEKKTQIRSLVIYSNFFTASKTIVLRAH
jgi:hypothetical protein